MRYKHNFKIMSKCFFCMREFQDGPERHEGHNLKHYKVYACDACYNSNWDGWCPAAEKLLLKHMHDNKIHIPERNKKGWLPREIN